uniref:Uncharacterized protein n=1 Tax=Prymnesium polylepis TaxID=72548 RepID=A0A7S4I1T4_9EUKA
MHFSFAGERTLLDACRDVLKATVEQMALGQHHFAESSTWNPSVAYELNDARSLEMPPEGKASAGTLRLAGIFFMVNRMAGGFCISVLYDTGKHDADAVDLLVAEWMDGWGLASFARPNE